MVNVNPPAASGAGRPSGPDHFRELFWKTLGRLLLLYFVPLILLAVFFHIQYRGLVRDGIRGHLEVIAEHQANTFDLFLRERLVDLGNILDDPRFQEMDLERELPGLLRRLQRSSPAFVDLGVVNAQGILRQYAGPVVYTDSVDYGNEAWFQGLTQAGRTSVITEIYMGFRGQPHFTLAVRRGDGAGMRVLRSALSPEQLASYLSTLEGASEVHAAIVNDEGVLQVGTGTFGDVLRPSGLIPPSGSDRGWVSRPSLEYGFGYAYARLQETPWALVVLDATGRPSGLGMPGTFNLLTLGIFLAMGLLILHRTRKVVGAQMATEEHEAELSGQLVQAAKLASVGELAAGIAHEINNPLAVIAEEVGVLRDSLDPQFDEDDQEPLDLRDHLDAIHEAVFRCRDITRKLLTFVRKTDVTVEVQEIHGILDEVLDIMLANELALSNIRVEKGYEAPVAEILADRNQLIQVLVNLVKNAIDAMPRGGRLTVRTLVRDGRVKVAVGDTGYGIPPEHLERVFMPFFTTKDPGKGTGLGLSVSYNIVRSLGGAFYVESAPGRGSTFTIEVPLAPAGPVQRL